MTDEPTFRDGVERATKAIENGIEHFNKIGDLLDGLHQLARNDKSIKPADLGHALFLLKDLYDQADKAVKRVYHFKDALDKNLLPERMKEMDIDGFRIPEIARSFSIVEKTSATMLDKEKAFEWLRETGQGDLIQETVNAGTLASFCRNLLLEEGREPPPEIIKVSTYSTTSMVKYRPK